MRGAMQIRQVVVAFGASQVPSEALEAAAELAAMLHAEMRTLLVEESWLEQVAAHPVTAELYLGSRTIQPWDRDRLRLELRVRAEQSRRAVRQLAERRGVRISFEVTQGDVSAVLEQTGGSDILTTIVAGGRPAFPSSERSRLAMIDALRRSRGFTLVHREGRIDRLPVLVYYDGSVAAQRALEIVGVLRPGGHQPIRVLLPPATADASMSLVAEVEAWRLETGVRVVVQQLASTRERDLERTLLQLRRSLIVLPARTPVLSAASAGSVLDSASAVLVVCA